MAVQAPIDRAWVCLMVSPLASIIFVFVALFGGLLSENGPHGLYHATVVVAAAVLVIALLTDRTIFRRGERPTSLLRVLLSWKSLENTIMQYESYKRATELTVPTLFINGLLDFFIIRRNIRLVRRANPRYVRIKRVLGPHELTPRQGRTAAGILDRLAR